VLKQFSGIELRPETPQKKKTKKENNSVSAIYQWRVLSLSPRGFLFWAKKAKLVWLSPKQQPYVLFLT
jgi:hypothetical protein